MTRARVTKPMSGEKFVLDTNAVIALVKGDQRFIAKITQHVPNDICMTSITLHELYYGACKSQRRAENLARIELLKLEVLPFDEQDALSAGTVRASLAAAGTPIGPLDVLIAGAALARKLTLVTHNTREFERVSDLRLADWK